ncbi:MAG TPA: ATP-binding protein [Terriglobia bacterium]|nr:ATP-binding protein [Terriglobia bacterium]
MKILIADDDAVSRLRLSSLLSGWRYETIAVGDGLEACRVLKDEQEAPKLAILDWIMPGMDGVDVVHEVRKLTRQVPPYIILLTSLDSTSDTVRGLEAGADEYIKKPFKPEELRARLQVGARIVQLQTSLAQRISEVEAALGAQKLAEEALQKSEERSRLLFATIPQPVWVYDPETLRFLEVNDAAVQRYGYSRQEFLAMNLTDMQPQEQVSRLLSHLVANPHPERQFSGEWQHRTKDGRMIDVEISSHGMELLGRDAVMVVAQDVTERKRLEIELRHAQKLEAVGGLAAGIAHELNTPIQFVGDNIRFLQEAFGATQRLILTYRSLSEAASSGSVDASLLESVRQAEEIEEADYLRDEVPKAMAQTLEGVNRVATIVRAMKEFAHPSHGDMAAADLNRAISNTLTVARNEIKYVADVETEFGDLPPVRCNLGDVNQVFLNLLVNSAHAIGDKVKGSGGRGLIRVRTWREEDAAVVAISDTGCGIPENIRTRIFEPFFTTKEVGRGTGQGLAISRSIVVDKHGGNLRFDTEVGRGTTFYVRLPVGQPASKQGVEPDAANSVRG